MTTDPFIPNRFEASAVERISDELRAELAANDVKRLVDPRHANVRVTHLAEIHKSGAHYLHSVQHGREETLALRLGIATHAIVFGTPKVVVYRGGTFPDAKGKPHVYSDVRNGRCWDAFQVEHAGDVIVNDAELKASEAKARAIRGDMDAEALLFGDGTRHEVALEYVVNGRKRTGRIDALGPRFLVDLKDVKSTEPRRFRYQARDLHWHAKLAWYVDMADACGFTGREPVLAAVEKAAPHVVQVFHLTDKDYAAGRRLYLEWWDKLMECERRNEWPGYHSGPLPLALDTLPGWREPDDEEDDDGED